MNKVVSIEIAGQVFWIDELAYEALQNYLNLIQQQLKNDESAQDIFQDIELRVAEILFELSSSEKKAVTLDQLNRVIEQVGYIDSDNLDEPTKEIQRKSYLDPHNKILGGVCAGLATRLKVPAFIIRLTFIGLTMVFGLGIALYLVYWFSLESKNSRNAGLAAEGIPQTAKKIADYETPKENAFIQLQRILFLPISLVGTFIRVIGDHLRKRRGGYSIIFKCLFAAVFVVLSMVITALMVEFNQSQLFPLSIGWLLSASAMYLIVFIFFALFKKTFLPKKDLKVEKKLKLGALIPASIIVGGISYLTFSLNAFDTETTEKHFLLTSNQLSLSFNAVKPDNHFYSNVSYQLKTSELEHSEIIVTVDYKSAGRNDEDVKNNIHGIDYFYTFDKNTLVLDQYWTLKEGVLNREQSVLVTIEVPQNITVSSPWSFVVDDDRRPFIYQTFARHSSDSENRFFYMTRGEFFHENGELDSNKLSDNEQLILQVKFCEEFFISESWGCRHNLGASVFDNQRFDRAFAQDSETIEELRLFLLPNRSLFVSQLDEMNETLKKLSVVYPVMSPFQEYIQHLLNIKAEMGRQKVVRGAVANRSIDRR